MSELWPLVIQKEPLDAVELDLLREWLAVLAADCIAFGETPEDQRKMIAIASRIRKEEQRSK